jgi:dolichol-phosphate mannosyltransferase
MAYILVLYSRDHLGAGAISRLPESTVVVPTYNERGNIERIVGELLSQSPDLSVMVVDDGSPDGTGEAAVRLARTERRLEVLLRPRKSGLGSAYREAFSRVLARGSSRYVLEIDADFSHDPAMIPALIRTAERKRADLVIGSRYVKGGGISGWDSRRLFLSSSANKLCSLLLGGRVGDYTAGLRCYRARSLRRVDLRRVRSEGYAFQVEMTFEFLRRRMKVTEVPIVFSERGEGVSKFGSGIVAEAAALLVLLFLKRLII